MDRHMPGMDGLETTRQIRRDTRFAELPIVAMTADVVGASREECQAAGMNDFVSKPFAADALLEVIARWVKPNLGVSRGAAVSNPAPAPSPVALPGIDVATGLRYLSGEQSLYRPLLLRFRGDYATADRRIAELLAASRYLEAEREAHSLKGLAGQIGAHDLRDRAAELQVAIKSREANLEGPLAALAASLAIVIGGLAGLEEIASVRQGTVVAGESIGDLSDKLTSLVSASDPDARKLAERLRDALSGDARSQVDALMQCLERYDFSAASQALSSVVATIEAQEETR
jgi:two-component system sensor histidine kinase/response regulator